MLLTRCLLKSKCLFPQKSSIVDVQLDSDYASEHYWSYRLQRRKDMKDFLTKCNQICREQRIWSHLLRKSFMENFIFCAVCRSAFSKKFYLLSSKNHPLNSRIILLFYCCCHWQYLQHWEKSSEQIYEIKENRFFMKCCRADFYQFSTATVERIHLLCIGKNLKKPRFKVIKSSKVLCKIV